MVKQIASKTSKCSISQLHISTLKDNYIVLGCMSVKYLIIGIYKLERYFGACQCRYMYNVL
jgi:hypothetical protein